MKKPNWKIVNIALWTEVILSYVLPFQTVDNFQYRIGFPIPFLSIYQTGLEITPLLSMHLNPFAFLANAIILYFVIAMSFNIYHKIKKKRSQ